MRVRKVGVPGLLRSDPAWGNMQNLQKGKRKNMSKKRWVQMKARGHNLTVRFAAEDGALKTYHPTPSSTMRLNLAVLNLALDGEMSVFPHVISDGAGWTAQRCETVLEGDECPDCGEDRIDYLVWQSDGVTVRCSTCGEEYQLEDEDYGLEPPVRYK